MTTGLNMYSIHHPEQENSMNLVEKAGLPKEQ
jgi:hypothetical protein